ncbi:MAG: NUDIX hydrolase [Victivallaceae bacterium]|nr:NUDIX hydrolase [Victivallaceae bacterium]
MYETDKRNVCRLAVEVTGGGKWLQLSTIKYRASDGMVHSWECADRVASNGAVVIIPLFKSTNEIILVRQYRPPVDKFVIEFPAGLIDDGETAATTAKRELLEETGYRGSVISVSCNTYNSPGMSGERTEIATVEIDEAFHVNNPPVTQMEGTEDIETFIVKRDNLMKFIQQAEAAGDGIDSKVMAFAIASI